MPAYDYLCEEHGVQEVTHSIKESPVICCEQCQKPMQRQIGNTTFVTLGGGWTGKFYASSVPLKHRKKPNP